MIRPTRDDVLKMEAVTVAIQAIEKPAAILAKLHEMNWRCPSGDPEVAVTIAALCAAAAVMMELMVGYGQKLTEKERSS